MSKRITYALLFAAVVLFLCTANSACDNPIQPTNIKASAPPNGSQVL